MILEHDNFILEELLSVVPALFFRVCIQTKSATSSLYTSSALAARNIALYFPAIQLSIPFAGARSTRKVSSYPDFICSVGLLCDQIITSVFILFFTSAHFNIVGFHALTIPRIITFLAGKSSVTHRIFLLEWFSPARLSNCLQAHLAAATLVPHYSSFTVFYRRARVIRIRAVSRTFAPARGAAWDWVWSLRSDV